MHEQVSGIEILIALQLGNFAPRSSMDRIQCSCHPFKPALQLRHGFIEQRKDSRVTFVIVREHDRVASVWGAERI